MKQFFNTMVLVLISTIAFGQNNINPVARDIKAIVQEGNLLMTWTGEKTTQEGSWQVEASRDGKSFNAIGLVWGADPKASGTEYRFKQNNDKLKPGYRYYRVMYVSAENETRASETIGLSK